ncbi:amidohydrolase [Paeniglutamicibacter sp. NPDC012692]|uniref:amidohydrolase n=1 Tax=Paeniglutamicibacter sp. NPDC012692 TaxID=3364388 RepID=UPI0036B14CA7
MMIDTILDNGRILTCDTDYPQAQRIGLHRGRIMGVDGQLDGLTAQKTVNLDGAVVVPGFNDVHAHSVWFGLSMTELDLSAARTALDVYTKVASKAASLPEGEWIIGANLELLNLASEPTLAGLDAAAPNHMLFLKSNSGHSGLVNSPVLARIRQSAGYSLEVGSGIVRDRHGNETGLLEENALRLVQALFMPYPLASIEDALERATAVYASEGLTSVTDAGIAGGWIGNSPIEFAAYQNVLERGTLRTRMSPMITLDALNLDAGGTRTLQTGIRTGLGDDRLRLGPVKIFTDGSLLGATAAMTEPYCGCDHGNNTGYLQADALELTEAALAAASAGWTLALHAIGDAAVDLAVETIEKARERHGAPRSPHRIEHGGYVRPDQIARIAANGIVLVPQPHFINAFGDGMRELLGEERTRYSYPVKSLLEAGAVLPGSSDRPVADGRPLRVMQSFVERTTASGAEYGPGERITATEALRAYTVGSAATTGTGDRLGQLRPNYLADLTVLADDPTTIESSRIGSIEVVATALGGKATHDPHGLFARSLHQSMYRN